MGSNKTIEKNGLDVRNESDKLIYDIGGADIR
jgi:hypothetical protein